MLPSLIIQHPFNFKKYYWKSTVIVLLDFEYLILPKDLSDKGLSKFIINTDSRGMPINSILSTVKYFLELACLNHSETIDEHSSHLSIFEEAICILDSLCQIHLAERIEEDNSQGLTQYKYCLTEKGVDIALKLQEHNDNKERFILQNNISITMKRNSNIALVLSILLFPSVLGSLYLSYQRLDIAEHRLELIENKNFITEVKNSVKSIPLENILLKEPKTINNKQ
jgi:hypothetical protein